MRELTMKFAIFVYAFLILGILPAEADVRGPWSVGGANRVDIINSNLLGAKTDNVVGYVLICVSVAPQGNQALVLRSGNQPEILLGRGQCTTVYVNGGALQLTISCVTSQGRGHSCAPAVSVGGTVSIQFLQ